MFDDLIRKAKEMEARAEACPLHEWEVCISKLPGYHPRTTADGQPIGSLVCKNCGMRIGAGMPDPHRNPEYYKGRIFP